MKEDQIAFIRGAACAIATIVHGHGIGTETREAFSACIGAWSDLEAAGCDQFDIDILAPHFKPTPDQGAGSDAE